MSCQTKQFQRRKKYVCTYFLWGSKIMSTVQTFCACTPCLLYIRYKPPVFCRKFTEIWTPLVFFNVQLFKDDIYSETVRIKIIFFSYLPKGVNCLEHSHYMLTTRSYLALSLDLLFSSVSPSIEHNAL